MCNTTITFGNGVYGLDLTFDFSLPEYKHCWTKFVTQELYHVSFQFLEASSVNNSCTTAVTLTHSEGALKYPFCEVDTFLNDEVILGSHENLTLHFDGVKDIGVFEILMYVFKIVPTCQSELSCNNGRCLDRELFCDIQYNFCGDDTVTGSCHGGDRPFKDDYFSYNNMSYVGPMYLGMFCVIVVLFTICFCCKSKRVRKLCGIPDFSSRTPRHQSEPGVYFVNVSGTGTSDDGYDYVIDFKKFCAPPDYSTLKDISKSARKFKKKIKDKDSDDTNSNVTDGATGNLDTTQGVADSNVDELPEYDHVMTNTEAYDLNHHHL